MLNLLLAGAVGGLVALGLVALAAAIFLFSNTWSD